MVTNNKLEKTKTYSLVLILGVPFTVLLKFHSYSAKFALVSEIAINNSSQMSSSLLSSLDHSTAFTFVKAKTRDFFNSSRKNRKFNKMVCLLKCVHILDKVST